MFVLESFCYKSTFCDTDSTTQPFCVFVSLCVGRINIHMYVPVCIEIKCHHCTQKNLCVCVFIHMCHIYGYDVCLCACSYMCTCMWSMGMIRVYGHIPMCTHVSDLCVWCVSTCVFLCMHMCVIYGYDVCLCACSCVSAGAHVPQHASRGHRTTLGLSLWGKCALQNDNECMFQSRVPPSKSKGRSLGMMARAFDFSTWEAQTDTYEIQASQGYIVNPASKINKYKWEMALDLCMLIRVLAWIILLREVWNLRWWMDGWMDIFFFTVRKNSLEIRNEVAQNF